MNGSPDVSWCRKGGARGYVTTQTVSWNLMWKGSPYVLHIPPGREFESSVPRNLQWLWSPDDPFFLNGALNRALTLAKSLRYRKTRCCNFICHTLKKILASYTVGTKSHLSIFETGRKQQWASSVS